MSFILDRNKLVEAIWVGNATRWVKEMNKTAQVKDLFFSKLARNPLRRALYSATRPPSRHAVEEQARRGAEARIEREEESARLKKRPVLRKDERKAEPDDPGKADRELRRLLRGSEEAPSKAVEYHLREKRRRSGKPETALEQELRVGNVVKSLAPIKGLRRFTDKLRKLPRQTDQSVAPVAKPSPEGTRGGPHGWEGRQSWVKQVMRDKRKVRAKERADITAGLLAGRYHGASSTTARPPRPSKVTKALRKARREDKRRQAGPVSRWDKLTTKHLGRPLTKATLGDLRGKAGGPSRWDKATAGLKKSKE